MMAVIESIVASPTLTLAAFASAVAVMHLVTRSRYRLMVRRRDFELLVEPSTLEGGRRSSRPALDGKSDSLIRLPPADAADGRARLGESR